MENLKNTARVALQNLPVPVPDEEHQHNAQLAASYAVDFVSFAVWERDGADPDDAQEVQVAAVAYLPDEQFSLLAMIAVAGDGEKDGDERRLKRAAHAVQSDPSALRTLVVWMGALIDWLEDNDDDNGGNNGAPALRPRPRRKRRGYGMG